jgi:hypothetical protein
MLIFTGKVVANTAISSLIVIIGVSLTNTAAKAQETAKIECVKQYIQLGISPDAALLECNKTSLSDCVKKLTASKVVAKGVSESQNSYLVDLGDNETRWLEGKGWKEKGCTANTQGQYKRQSDKFNTFFGNQRSYEWFRQGFCSTPTIQLEQNYTIDEAKTLCELGIKPKDQ